MTRKWFHKSGVVVLLLLSLAGKSQQKYEIGVKEAVDIAFKNVADLKNVHLDYKIAVARNKEITAAALPCRARPAEI